MGNSPLRPEQKSRLSQQQFRERSRSVWTHRQDCLFYSSSPRSRSHSYAIVQHQLDLAHPIVKRYFERLRIMDRYLHSANLYFPLMCLGNGIEECACTTENTKLISLYYESFEIKLADEVRARRMHGHAFNEAELWFMLYHLLNATRRFEPFCQKSGRISFQDVLLNTKGEIRLKCILSSPFASEERLPELLSPEQLQSMRTYFGKEIYFNRYVYKQMNLNPNICQTFSLGILLLSLADSAGPQVFYLPELHVNGRKIGQALERITRRYSRLLVNLLKAMLSGYACRPLPSQIYEVFSHYQDFILHFMPFHEIYEKNRLIKQKRINTSFYIPKVQHQQQRRQ